jgi:hypothetical protein
MVISVPNANQAPAVARLAQGAHKTTLPSYHCNQGQYVKSHPHNNSIKISDLRKNSSNLWHKNCLYELN